MTEDSESVSNATQLSGEQLEKLAQLDQEIEAEERRWQAGGFSHHQIGIDHYMVTIKLRTMVRIVQEVLGVDDYTMNVIFKEEIIEQMKRDRQMMMEAKRAQITVAKKQILGPGGHPLLNGD